jgi:hypothetical protein
MIRVLIACAVTAALTITLTGLLEERGRLGGIASAAGAETLIPSCPQPHYYANGNVGPPFCVIDNPVALRFYAPVGKRTSHLDRTPIQDKSTIRC